MRLEIGNFYVQDIAFGETLAYCDGVLSINKQELWTISKKMTGSPRLTFT